MELTEIGKDCRKQVWSWGKSGAQFCDLEHKPNLVTSQLKSFFDARIKSKHPRIVYKVLKDMNLVYIAGLHHSQLAYNIIFIFPSNKEFYNHLPSLE